MSKIKICAIVILTSYGVSYAFLNIIPIWLGISLALVSLCSFILLNTEALKTRGIIKTLTTWADIVLGLMALLFFVPQESTLYITAHYFSNFLLLVFAGFVTAILVNAYKEEKM